MAWQFKHTEDDREFEPIPVGRYRVVIVEAEKAVSKSSGNDMLVIKMLVSGYKSHVWAYIPFLDDKPEVTNRILTQFFECFDIEEGNFDLNSYLGKAGGVAIKHDEYDGKTTAKFHYFLWRREVDKLPPFVGEVPSFDYDELPLPDDDGTPWD